MADLARLEHALYGGSRTYDFSHSAWRLPDLAGDGRSAHVQVAEAVRAAIKSGNFRPGQQVPSIDVLIRRYGVSLYAVNKAIKTLAGEGLVRSVRPRGVFVCGVPEGGG